jgi:hypothetical protein
MTPDEEKIIALIPAEFHMISGSHDVQTSADVFNVNKVCTLCVYFFAYVTSVCIIERINYIHPYKYDILFLLPTSK